MIFGDAGYGCVLLLISLFGIAKTAKKGTPPALVLLLLLAISNTLWGVFTCSWFGFPLEQVPQFFKDISLSWLSTAKGASQSEVNEHLMLFCFSLALAQLGVAHIKAFLKKAKAGTLACIAELGQLGMLVGMFQVVLCLVVYNQGFGGVVEMGWPLYALLGGFVLVFVFAKYEGNILKSIATSCANIISTVLGVTNVFSDVMSYIRLWAVGLAGASLSQTVDTLATPMLGGFMVFAGVILLIFGHGFNMALNVLSVLVHGVRLNTLEFSSNIGLGWSGFAYKPFAKRGI
jgi:V/A-type H+-transporting ATPase subunit I